MKRRKKGLRIFLVLSFIALSISLKAQVQVKGTVVDSKGEALIGVAVVQSANTSKGTITDFDGNFSLSVPDKNTMLTFSYIGFKKEEVKVTPATAMRIVMQEESAFLEEVVVIGYQEMRRKDLTGSVAKANMDDILKAPTASFDQALGGRLAGVQVSSGEGSPGSSMNIIIRGANSITGDNSPLYVIDGFQVEDPSVASTINPNDIESIDVLKDASATAIYGARGANGVVMITTKKGKAGAPKLSYDFSAGVQRITKKLKLMDAYEFVKLQAEVSPIDINGENGYFQTYEGKTYTLDDYRNIPQYDWQDMIFKDAWQQSHNLTLTGGKDGIRYNVSASIFDQDGIVIRSNYNRVQGRGALTVRQKKFHTYLAINYSNSKQVGASPSQTSYSGMNNLFYSVWGYRPVTQPNVELSSLLNNIQDPSVDSQNDYRFNPIMSLQNDYNKRFIENMRANGFVEYEIMKNLKLKVLGTYSTDIRRQEVFNNSKTRYGYPGSANGVNANLTVSERRTWLNENTLAYQKTFNKKHSFSALAGITFEDSRYKFNYQSYNNIPFESLGMAGIKNGQPGNPRSTIEEASAMSYLARANYNYDGKYYLTGSIRADGSSKFAKDNRWGYFPSASGAWNFSEESFFEPLKNIVNSAKLRAGWGLTGNNRVGPYDRFDELKQQAESLYPYINQNGTGHGVYPLGEKPTSVGVIPTRLGNKDLKWETTGQVNVGIDLVLLRDRITFTADWYNKNTYDLLMAQELPFSSGYGEIVRNIGEVNNKGIEFTLNTVNISTKLFKWSSSFNISFNRNKVKKLADGIESMLTVAEFDQNFNGLHNYIAKKDFPIGMIYGYVYEGTYKYDDFDRSGNTYSLKPGVPAHSNEPNTQPGFPKYKDLNGDGIINNDDRTVIGKGDPKHIGGFTNNFEYKDFDLSVFLQWSYGNDILNANKLMFESGFNRRRDLNQFASYADRWTPENPNSDIPSASQSSSNSLISSRIVEDGSYLRIKNVALGYTLPIKVVKKLHIDKARVYVSVQNLYTFTNYSGYDPEVSIKNSALNPGLDFSAYPRARTIDFGINLSF